MTHECLVCGDEEGDLTPLLVLGCGKHYVCMDPESKCLADAFSKAIRNEQLYPVKCCGEILLIDEYQEYIPDLIPFELYMSFKEKEQEYATQARYRVYCANKECGEYLHRQNYCKVGTINCAKCDRCNAYTCTYCKNIIQSQHTCSCDECALCELESPHAIMEHECVESEFEKQFRDAVKRNGYQECYGCGNTVELAEACNHMTCSCGCEFCYICGKVWQGYHACPRYGPPVYDDEGYNQDGFHRDTGVNRDGYARGGRRDDGDDDEDDIIDDGNDDEIDDEIDDDIDDDVDDDVDDDINDDNDDDEDEDENENENEEENENGDEGQDEGNLEGGFDMTGIDDDTRQLILVLPRDLQQEVWEQARFAAIDRGDIVPPEEEEDDGRDNDEGENVMGAVEVVVETVSEDNGQGDNVGVSNEPNEQTSAPTNVTPDAEGQSQTDTQSLPYRPADPARGDETA